MLSITGKFTLIMFGALSEAHAKLELFDFHCV